MAQFPLQRRKRKALIPSLQRETVAKWARSACLSPLSSRTLNKYHPFQFFLVLVRCKLNIFELWITFVFLDTNYTRVIVRDFAGKYSWDLSCLYGQWNGSTPQGRSQSVPCSGNEISDHLIGLDSLSLGNQEHNAPPCPPPRLNPNPPPLAINVNYANSSAPDMDTCSPTLAKQAERYDGRLRSESRSGSESLRTGTPQFPFATQSHGPSFDVLNSVSYFCLLIAFRLYLILFAISFLFLSTCDLAVYFH